MLRFTLDVVAQIGGDVLGHVREVSLLRVTARRRRSRSRRTACRRRCRLAVITVGTGGVRVDTTDTAAVGKTTMSTHVGVVGKVLAADGAGELMSGGRGGRGGATKAT